MSVKNVIFDFGQVLVRFEPEYMVKKYVNDKKDIELLTKVVFDRLYWDKLDLGTITDEQTLELCYKRLPERLWEVARTIYYNWIYNIPEVEGMSELVSYIKKKYNVKLLVLSNISKYFAEHSAEIDILKGFDHCVFSSSLQIVKPDRRIFEYICNTHKILPSESLFIDDNESNIRGAEKFGIKGYIFDGNAGKLKEYLDDILAQAF